MWWREPRATVSRFAPLAIGLALAGLLAGCFEPLYGEKTLAGGPGLNQRLRAVDVDPDHGGERHAGRAHRGRIAE